MGGRGKKGEAERLRLLLPPLPPPLLCSLPLLSLSIGANAGALSKLPGGGLLVGLLLPASVGASEGGCVGGNIKSVCGQGWGGDGGVGVRVGKAGACPKGESWARVLAGLELPRVAPGSRRV